MGRFLKLYWLLKNYGLFQALKIFLLLGRRNFFKVPGIKHHIHLRKNTTDIPTFEQVFITQEYDIPFNDPSIIIDGGANVGLASAYFASHFPEARVYAIEPEPSNFEMLKKNTYLYDNITPIQAALWYKNDELEIVDQGFGAWAFAVAEQSHQSVGKTTAISIPHLMEAYNLSSIDVLKIDIEGAEKELFSEGFETWLPHVKTLLIELHDQYKVGCSKQFFDTMRQYDFSFHATEDILCLRNLKFQPKTAATSND